MDDQDEAFKIRWPEEFQPGKSPIFVSNRLTMNVAPGLVWAWLVRATRWPSWYPNAADVRYEDQVDPDLQQGTKFHWKTFGLKLRSEVTECVFEERLAWEAHGFGVRAYHAWLIRPVDGGCEVLTQETQHGFFARLGKVFQPGRMYQVHQTWLEALQRQAQGGPP